MFGRRGLAQQAEVAVPAYPAPPAAAFVRLRGGQILPFKPVRKLPELPRQDQVLTAIKDKIYDLLMQQIDMAAAAQLPRSALEKQIVELVSAILVEQKLPLSRAQEQALAALIIDDMLGFGPLEPLLRDDSVSDIMVNGYDQVYVERQGKLELTHVKFRDNKHVMAIATRIVNGVGRRVDESHLICDARLPDGSRINVIGPPCAVRGPAMSIRKFSQKKLTLDTMVAQGNIPEALATILKICGAIRLNIVISGGTGSGKTTLLNAISQTIRPDERIVTIEDAAELQLQQPHVVTLETRHANLEGEGEVTIRDLVKNALRMRPDRIILGEVRGAEAFDLLQAMNTGHDGSMGTLHANNPREALVRLENMIGMAGIQLPGKAVRGQIASAIHLIVHTNRDHNGVRRITHLTEIVGMDNDTVVTQDLITFDRRDGHFRSTGIRPNFIEKAMHHGLDKALMRAMVEG